MPRGREVPGSEASGQGRRTGHRGGSPRLAPAVRSSSPRQARAYGCGCWPGLTVAASPRLALASPCLGPDRRACGCTASMLTSWPVCLVGGLAARASANTVTLTARSLPPVSLSPHPDVASGLTRKALPSPARPGTARGLLIMMGFQACPDHNDLAHVADHGGVLSEHS